LKYAETLVAFIERAQSGVRLEGVAMASARTRARRIERVLDARHMPSRRLGKLMTTSVAFVLMSLCYVTAVARPGSAIRAGANARCCERHMWRIGAVCEMAE
jgi:hypothetical protein